MNQKPRFTHNLEKQLGTLASENLPRMFTLAAVSAALTRK
jgi:hypothetical protein